MFPTRSYTRRNKKHCPNYLEGIFFLLFLFYYSTGVFVTLKAIVELRWRVSMESPIKLSAPSPFLLLRKRYKKRGAASFKYTKVTHTKKRKECRQRCMREYIGKCLESETTEARVRVFDDFRSETDDGSFRKALKKGPQKLAFKLVTKEEKGLDFAKLTRQH